MSTAAAAAQPGSRRREMALQDGALHPDDIRAGSDLYATMQKEANGIHRRVPDPEDSTDEDEDMDDYEGEEGQEEGQEWINGEWETEARNPWVNADEAFKHEDEKRVLFAALDSFGYVFVVTPPSSVLFLGHLGRRRDVRGGIYSFDLLAITQSSYNTIRL